MKFLFTAAIVLVASAFPNNEWTQYKEQYNKVYTSEQEDNARYNQYLKTKKMIEEHNIRFEKGETSYWMGINRFSDWFAEEIQDMLDIKPSKTNSNGGKPFELSPGTLVPDSINWVEKGAVTRVKDQGECKSSYAFSAAGALEGLMFTTNKTITDLSVQELVDCSEDNYACNGGFKTNCFIYVIRRGGIDTDASYPYKAYNQQCKADKGVIGATCTNYISIQQEEAMKEVVGTVGPVSIGFAVDDDSFVHYKGGIFDGHCTPLLIHAMLAVGYDKDEKSGKDYWLVKNSWGEKWGEEGYVRIIRNVNKCDIASHASYPVYSPSN